MNRPDVVGALNRLLHVLCRSLPMYLLDAKPWARREHEQVQGALNRLAADQRGLAGRVAQAIAEQGGRPDPGRFPMEFAAVNDLALDFLRQKLVECQRRDAAAIARCLPELDSMPRLRSLAEEALGNARRHLEILNKMMNDE